MLQREIVRFRASDTQPNPLEVDYWIDVTSNYYGGCIRYYRNDTNTWETLDLNDKNEINDIKGDVNNIKQDITNINNNIDDINQDITNINSSIEEIRQDITNIVGSDLRSYVNSEIIKAKNELKTYVDGKVTDLTELINQETENRTNADNNLQSQINELRQLITNAQNAIDTHAARRDNPHVVTRAQLSLATTDSVVFNKVSAPSGFFKE